MDMIPDLSLDEGGWLAYILCSIILRNREHV